MKLCLTAHVFEATSLPGFYRGRAIRTHRLLATSGNLDYVRNFREQRQRLYLNSERSQLDASRITKALRTLDVIRVTLS